MGIPSGSCRSAWQAWPSVQATGAEEKSFLVFRLFDAVGNLFLSLRQVIQVSSIVLDHTNLPILQPIE